MRTLLITLLLLAVPAAGQDAPWESLLPQPPVTPSSPWDYLTPPPAPPAPWEGFNVEVEPAYPQVQPREYEIRQRPFQPICGVRDCQELIVRDPLTGHQTRVRIEREIFDDVYGNPQYRLEVKP